MYYINREIGEKFKNFELYKYPEIRTSMAQKKVKAEN